MLARKDELVGPLGVVGGFVQAQAQVQVLAAMIDDGCNPQAALDRPRFRVEGDHVLLEKGLWEERDQLAAHGVQTVRSDETRWQFGCGQAIVVDGAGLAGGADSRGDGAALGL
jgi:gamma-glutamyltranspeptidase/glutathione hydrolase